MTKDELRQLISEIRQSNAIPKMDYHFKKHSEDFSVYTKEEYQRVLDSHVLKQDMRFFTTVQKNGVRVWYLVDEQDSIISEYNENARQHYSIYRSQSVSSFLNGIKDWAVEVDGSQAKVLLAWKP